MQSFPSDQLASSALLDNTMNRNSNLSNIDSTIDNSISMQNFPSDQLTSDALLDMPPAGLLDPLPLFYPPAQSQNTTTTTGNLELDKMILTPDEIEIFGQMFFPDAAAAAVDQRPVF